MIGDRWRTQRAFAFAEIAEPSAAGETFEVRDDPGELFHDALSRGVFDRCELASVREVEFRIRERQTLLDFLGRDAKCESLAGSDRAHPEFAESFQVAIKSPGPDVESRHQRRFVDRPMRQTMREPVQS